MKNTKIINKRLLKEDRGITLVALVVTIVVLLILAGISLNLVLGTNGIITKANQARTNWANASEEEGKMLNDLATEIASYLDNDGAEGSGDDTTIPVDLTKYILGEDGNGGTVNFLSIYNVSQKKFVGNEYMPNADTLLTVVDINTEEMVGHFIYSGKVYTVTASKTDRTTQTLEVASDYATENGFVVKQLNNSTWGLIKTPDGEYTVPTSVAGNVVGTVLTDLISGTPIFANPVNLGCDYDPLMPSVIKVTTSDSSFIDYLITCIEGMANEVTVYVTAEVKANYPDVDYFVVEP